MSEGIANLGLELWLRLHERSLRVVEDLDDQALRVRPGRATSIAFNLWHIARWDDHLASLLSDMTPSLHSRLGSVDQVWAREGVARAWGFASERLGHVETGMGMDEEASAQLPMPSKDALLAYVRAAYGSLETALAALVEADLAREAHIDPSRTPWREPGKPPGSVASWVFGYLDHAGRHLGMIEALKGISGRRGTASA
jgi:hypothetical protein